MYMTEVPLSRSFSGLYNPDLKAVAKHAQRHYTSRAARYGGVPERFTTGEQWPLMDPDGYLPIHDRATFENTATLARKLYRAVLDTVIEQSYYPAAKPESWASLLDVAADLPEGDPGLPLRKKMRARSKVPINNHVARMPNSLVPQVTVSGRLQNLAVQAIAPEDVNMAAIRRAFNEGRYRGSDLEIGATDLETYLLLGADLYPSPSPGEEPRPAGWASNLVITTWGILGKSENAAVTPRIITYSNLLNSDLVASPPGQAASAYATVLANAARH